MTVYSCNQSHTVHNQALSINQSIIWHLRHLALAFRCCQHHEQSPRSVSLQKKKGLEINIWHFWKHSKCWRSNNSDILPVNVQYMLKQIWSLLLSVTEYMCAYTAVVAAIFCSVLSGDEAQICSEHTHKIKKSLHESLCRCSDCCVRKQQQRRHKEVGGDFWRVSATLYNLKGRPHRRQSVYTIRMKMLVSTLMNDNLLWAEVL